MTGSCRPRRWSRRRRLPVHLAVYLLALRHPVLVARQLASVAELAPGRVVFGVGVGGDDRHEIEVSGVDPSTRGRRTDESLEILRGLLAGDEVTFHGECFDVDDARILPVPSPRSRSWSGVDPTPRCGAPHASPTAGSASGCHRSASRRWSIVVERPGRERSRAHSTGNTSCSSGAGSVLPVTPATDLASAMEQLYQIPFERFERTSPSGRPQDVADALLPYVEAGVRSVDIVAAGADTERALEGAAAAREGLLVRCR